MKRLFIPALLFGVVILYFYLVISGVPKGEKGRISSVSGAYPDIFFDGRYFSVISSSPRPLTGKKILGAVVPHHLLAHGLIGEVLASLKEQEPSLVVLVGPNHYNRGEPLMTSSRDWQTPFGVVETDQELVEQITGSSRVKINEEVVGGEHSVGNLMPFIKFYLPGARVFPLILHHDVSLAEVQSLARQIFLDLDEEAVLIASIDFSHDLPSQEAAEKDRETLQELKAGNLARIFRMGSEYLDSPPSLGFLWAAMQQKGLEEFLLLENTNSGFLLGNDLIGTTSYITLVYCRSSEDDPISE
ncbi:MAG TPA: AmmeMemoRadiSam system protein B [Clostridia bacterium]|nr:AmmeMemoRadiSam system protein B [Clostridia bacterium]